MVLNLLWVLPLTFPRKRILRTLACAMESTSPKMACPIAIRYEAISFHSFSIYSLLNLPVEAHL